MKKIQLIVNAVLVLAVGCLYVLHFACGGKTTPNNVTGAVYEGEVAPAGSIVYLQIDSLVNSYDMYHDLRGELEVKVKGMEDDLSKRSKSFERNVNDYKEKIQKGLVTRSQAEQLEQQLSQKQQELATYSERLRNELAEEEAVMLRRIYDAITTYLKTYNADHNYSLIISTNSSTNTVIQGHPGLDITRDVLIGLNATYTRPKK
ncbi:MAG: OmpH family outer membrane protein [Prevotellaceae bacterium]|jgi:outer membrane protein|nr:OmpH family outer membrane protein [Prevotellaceae bacterium]